MKNISISLLKMNLIKRKTKTKILFDLLIRIFTHILQLIVTFRAQKETVRIV